MNRVPVYRYSLVSVLKLRGLTSRHPYKKILSFMRFLTLIILALLCGKPQFVDPKSKIEVKGIDMMLVVDVSGSMQYSDFNHETRIDVAKKEAMRFAAKREHDPMGIVLFGKHALSRCPLTLDKRILHALLNEIEIGVVDPDGTVLTRAIIAAVNRLKNSESMNKVIILLTDGEPSEGDLSHNVALEAARRFNIKIYTIGIGSEEQKFAMHPFYGRIALPKVNKELLDLLARETGGKSFLAKNPDDMRTIYDTIDSLEKTVHETDIFSKYYDVFVPFVLVVVGILFLELLLATFVWFSI